MKILILGGSGMLGHTLFFELAERGLDVHTTVRSRRVIESALPPSLRERLVDGVDVMQFDSLVHAVAQARPDVVINAVGVIRQREDGNDPLTCIELNARFPHRLARLCAATGARVIHISTDCVFDGARGGYVEEDHPTAYDVYGISKYLGELRDPPTLTLRTSIIGHELRGRLSLVEWFLAQEGEVRGFDKAIYTGLPTCELARVIVEHVLPRPDLAGLYHVASAPISKYLLLSLVAEVYGKKITLHRDDRPAGDKSLVAERFRKATGYVAPGWRELVTSMRDRHLEFLKARG